MFLLSRWVPLDTDKGSIHILYVTSFMLYFSTHALLVFQWLFTFKQNVSWSLYCVAAQWLGKRTPLKTQARKCAVFCFFIQWVGDIARGPFPHHGCWMMCSKSTFSSARSAIDWIHYEVTCLISDAIELQTSIVVDLRFKEFKFVPHWIISWIFVWSSSSALCTADRWSRYLFVECAWETRPSVWCVALLRSIDFHSILAAKVQPRNVTCMSRQRYKHYNQVV